MTSPQRKVQHHYVDHANDAENSSSSMSATNSHSSDRTFPVTLHFLLNELRSDGLDHIISWQPHGRCFVVHNQAKFTETVLPMWFRQSKFASFQRQLNLYGFKRLTSGRDKGGYYHELFLRGKPKLAHKIPRTKLKNEGARKSTSPETEPNFYALSFLPDDGVPNTASAVTRETETKRAANSEPPSTRETVRSSGAEDLPSAPNRCNPVGSVTNSTYTLSQMAQSVNFLRLSQNLELLRNMNTLSTGFPATALSSLSSRNNAGAADLGAPIRFRDRLNSINDGASQPSQALTPLEQLFGQHNTLAPTTIPLPAFSNSTLAASPSILEVARVALVQHQQRLQHEEERQRLAMNANLLSSIWSSRNNINNNSDSNELLALRLAVANGYTSVEQWLNAVRAGGNPPMTSHTSEHDTSTKHDGPN